MTQEMFSATCVFRCHEILDALDWPMGSLTERLELLIAAFQLELAKNKASAEKTDRQRLLERLDDITAEQTLTLQQLADEALDRGDTDHAKAFGYLAQSGKWPIKRGQQWAWTTGTEERYCCSLRRSLFNLVTSNEVFLAWPSARAAIEAVVDVISSGRWQITKG